MGGRGRGGKPEAREKYLALKTRDNLVATPERLQPVHLRFVVAFFDVEPGRVVAHLDEESAVQQLVPVCFGEEIRHPRLPPLVKKEQAFQSWGGVWVE